MNCPTYQAGEQQTPHSQFTQFCADADLRNFVLMLTNALKFILFESYCNECKPEAYLYTICTLFLNFWIKLLIQKLDLIDCCFNN